MKTKIIILSSILVLVSFSTLHAQQFVEKSKVVAENHNILNSDRDIYDHFGKSVSISGNYAIIGTHHEDTDENGINYKKDAGAAYIFEYIGSVWKFKQKIIAPDRNEDDWFGISVAISGNYAIVGAPQEDEDVNGTNTRVNAGAAYIYKRNQASGGNWTFKQKIVAPVRAEKDRFGNSVSIYGDNAIVGAQYEDEDKMESSIQVDAGSAYIFHRTLPSQGWLFTDKLVAFDRAVNDRFGQSVSISGNYAIVGAYLEDEDSFGGSYISQSGSAYIFKQPGPGAPWILDGKIVANIRSAEDHFGSSVAISGEYVIVSAPLQYKGIIDPSLEWAGAAYIFERQSSSPFNWIQTQIITPTPRVKQETFGSSVAIDGNYVLIGAMRDDAGTGNIHNNSGAAYVLKRDSSPPTLGVWGQINKIVSKDLDAVDDFGVSVAISDCTALIGAWTEDEDASYINRIGQAGSAYFFECEPTPELCCDIQDVNITFNRVGKTDKYDLNISSAGVGIQEVEVSMIDYHVEYESTNCQPQDLGDFGNIRSNTLNFGGLVRTHNNTHSLTWEAGSPSVLNGSIGILISKPNLFDIRNCRNSRFYFCLKIKITDTDCNICEKIVCGSLELGPSQISGGGVFKK